MDLKKGGIHLNLQGKICNKSPQCGFPGLGRTFINESDLIWGQINFDLAIFDKNENDFREKDVPIDTKFCLLRPIFTKIHLSDNSLLLCYIAAKFNWIIKNALFFWSFNSVIYLWLMIRCPMICNQKVNIRLWSFKCKGSLILVTSKGFRGGAVIKNVSANEGNTFDPWVRKSPWNRKWQPTPVFLLGKFHGQRSLAGYSP